MSPGEGRLQSLARFFSLHWPRLLAGAALSAVFFGNQGFRGLARNWLELRRLRHEIAALKSEQGRLAERMRLLNEGDSALERVARKELGYIKPGEIEYRFPPPSQQ